MAAEALKLDNVKRVFPAPKLLEVSTSVLGRTKGMLLSAQMEQENPLLITLLPVDMKLVQGRYS